MILSGLTVAPQVASAQVLDHRYQTGVSVMPGIGYSVIVPYQEGKDCGDSSGEPSKRVCTNKVPFFLDFQLSFGVSSRVDLITDLRVGIGGQAVTNAHQFAFAPGLRVWIDQDASTKLYTTIQAVFDTTPQHRVGIPNTDFGLRNANGFMYDVIRNVGFFAQFGETIGFKRWFRIELDVGAGVQVRFP